MIFGLCAQILEDGLLPVPFHVIPVLDRAVTDGVVDSIGLGVGQCLVADEEVEVVDTPLARQVPRLGRHRWPARL